MTDTTTTRPPDHHLTLHSYAGPERRSSHRQWQDRIERRLNEGDQVMQQLRADLEANTASTTRVEANTSELVSLLNNAKGAFSVLDGLGKLARPVGAISALAASVVALWVNLKSGSGLK